MIDSKYFGKEIILKKPIFADLIMIDVSRESGRNVSQTFPVEIESGQTIIILGPVVDEFHRGALGILRTNYYPRNDEFLFDVKGVSLRPAVKLQGNLCLRYKYSSSKLDDFLFSHM